MASFGEIVRLAREARGWSQHRLAAEAGTSQSTIERVENNGSQRSRFILDIARVLDLPIPGGGPVPDVIRPPPTLMNDRDTMPVYAAAEGGDGHVIITHEEIDRVPRPYTLEGIPDAYAIYVSGDSMFPAYEPGDYAWVNPRLPPMRDTDCILYSVPENGDDERATIKRLISFDSKAWHLRQWNPKKDFPLERRLWNRHHRVVGAFRRR